MEWIEGVGYAAGICTTVAIVPQIIRLHRTGKVQALSEGMFLTLLFGISLWVVYGFFTQDSPVLITNGISASLHLYFLILYRIKRAGKRRSVATEGRSA